MPFQELERGYLSTPTNSAENRPLQPPQEILSNHYRLIEFTGNLRTSADLQRAGWDSFTEIKRFIGDINLGLINGLALSQAVAFSTRILTDHLRFYDAEFTRQEPVLPHHNYLGSWQGEKRWLGNNGRPVVYGIDKTERMGAGRREAEKTEKLLLEAENNSFVVSMSAEGPSGYLDENGSDTPHLNTQTRVEWKDQDGTLKGITLVTDLTIDQAERVMADLGEPTVLTKREDRMQRAVNLLENPATPSLPERYKNPFEYVFDKILAIRGEGDIRLRQKNGSIEVRPVAGIRQKIANFESLLDLNETKERLLNEFEEFILADYQKVNSHAFQQEIINLAEKAVLIFTENYLMLQGSNTPASSFINLPQYIEREGGIVRLRDERGDFRQAIAFLQTRAGCPSSVKTAGGGSTISGISVFGESDSMGSLYFPCPKCGAVNKRPFEGYVDNCQSCGSAEVSCKPSAAKTEKQKDSKELAKAA